MEVRENPGTLDRGAFVRPISPEEPSGPWLRREGLHASVQEAMRAAPGDHAYGLEEKKPDWELVVRLCSEALQTKTKDLYLAVCLLEAGVNTRGAEGLAAGLWAVAELHSRFGDDFHPRPRGGTQEGRINQLEALRRALPRILGAVPMSSALRELTWFQWTYVGQKLPGGTTSPFSEEDRENAIAGSESEFYSGGVKALLQAEAELKRLDALAAERYGVAAPSFAEAFEQLAQLRSVFAERVPSTIEDARVEQAEAQPSTRTASDEPAREIAPTSRRRTGKDPIERPSSDGPLAALFAALRGLRKREPGNALPYLAVRWLAFRDLSNSDPASPPTGLPAPTAAERARLQGLFEAGSWAELLERVEVLMEQPSSAYWLDLQRFASAAMGQIGAPYGAPQRELHDWLTRVLRPQAWLLEARLADGSLAADAITGPWLKDLLKASAPADPTSDGRVDSSLEGALVAARQAAARDGLERAVSELQKLRQGAPAGRERLAHTRSLARLMTEKGRHDLAVALLESAWNEVAKRSLEDWEGPSWTAALLAELEDALRALASASPSAKVDARLEELAAALTRLDPVRRLRQPKGG